MLAQARADLGWLAAHHAPDLAIIAALIQATRQRITREHPPRPAPPASYSPVTSKPAPAPTPPRCQGQTIQVNL